MRVWKDSSLKKTGGWELRVSQREEETTKGQGGGVAQGELHLFQTRCFQITTDL